MSLLDKVSPVITGCPGEQIGSTGIGSATAVVSWIPPSATDNSGIQTLTTTHEPGSAFPIGLTTVTYTSTDPSGNTMECTFDVNVRGEIILRQGIVRNV